MSGKALARADAQLGEIAIRLGVTPLMEFFSADYASLSTVIDDPEIQGNSAFSEEQWFSAAEGLRTVRGLIDHIRAEGLKIAAADQVLADLTDFERILSHLKEDNIRWHLAVDF